MDGIEIGKLEAANKRYADARLIKQIEQLQEALKKYGSHKENCAYIQGLRGNVVENCDCGFEQALKGETK